VALGLGTSIIGVAELTGEADIDQEQDEVVASDAAEEELSADEETSSGARYRTQRRGGKGIRDIKATKRNGRVVSIARVDDDDELLMMTARGKIQRIKASDISIIGRNTQGVRIMSLDEGDTLAAVVRVPKEADDDEENADDQPAVS
ncbi:MAG: hypothetical protein JJ992_11790, partial [Planctomycetes bacterium]|nr:hypothetical protein [Planctomycetota bacterium]